MAANHNNGAHGVVNGDDMMKRGLDNSQYGELMEREGKVIEYLPVGVTDFPTVLVGFTEEQIYNEIQPLLYSLPLADLLETVHAVLRQFHVPYECKLLLGTDTYIFDFPQIEGGRLMYIEVRPKFINPGFQLYSGYSFPDSTYDYWVKWGRRLENWMIRMNLNKAINYWREKQYSVDATTLPQLSKNPPGRPADSENDAAYRMIEDGGDTEEAANRAYKWWCASKNIANPTQRDRDNFKVSMKRAAERAARRSLRTE